MGGRAVLVVGSVNQDVVHRVPQLPSHGMTVIATRTEHFGGGKGANQSIAAARAGARTALVAAVGTDPAAGELLRELQDAGVNTYSVHVSPGSTGSATIAVAADGENFILIAPGANSAVGTLDDIDLPWEGSEFAVVLTQGEIPAASVVSAHDYSRLHGARFIMNLAPVIDLSAEVISHANPLIVNEAEAAALLDAAGTHPARIEDGARAIYDTFGCTVVVTLGAKGAIVVDDAGTLTAVAAPRVEAPVDTTGAGDAFTGTVAAFLARGASLIEAVRAGNAVGSLTVRSAGARASFADLQHILGVMENGTPDSNINSFTADSHLA